MFLLPLDGIVVDSISQELNNKVVGGRIVRIFQPERDEIIMYIRAAGNNFRLLFSANAGNPRVHLTKMRKENPSNPPNFCMVLRKHLLGGKILNISCDNFERVLTFNIESVNELGDLSIKKIIIEVMGRHSNIILINENGKIIDAIKHVDSEVNRIREIMPAREYVAPPEQDKISPLVLDIDAFLNANAFIKDTSMSNISKISIEKYLLNNIKGFSPYLCKEICFCAGISNKLPATDIINSSRMSMNLKNALNKTIQKIKSRNYTPYIIYTAYSPLRESNSLWINKKGNPLDFHCLYINQDDLRESSDILNQQSSQDSQGSQDNIDFFDSINTVLDIFYSERDSNNRLSQKINTLSRTLETHLERCKKKLFIQQNTLREVSDRDKLKLYGELIIAFIHSIPPNAKKVSLLNYYSPNTNTRNEPNSNSNSNSNDHTCDCKHTYDYGDEYTYNYDGNHTCDHGSDHAYDYGYDYVDVELDENKTPQENAQIYFKKYNKAESTYRNTSSQLKKTMEELKYLESVSHILKTCSSFTELEEIREELIEQGYITVRVKKGIKNKKSKKEITATNLLRYKSSDDFDIFVGKNNKQNDFLTFKFSGSKDMWFHVRNMPGSHVLIKCHKKDVPESTMEEAASIAAWHSKASGSSNVPVDYTFIKHVRKPSGAKPGMVTYENFKTIFVTPDDNLIEGLRFKSAKIQK